jgi:hypothetical protein
MNLIIIFPQHNANLSLNILVDNLFVNIFGTIFYKNKYSTNRYLFDCNWVLYWYVNNFEVLQYFQLKKHEFVYTGLVGYKNIIYENVTNHERLVGLIKDVFRWCSCCKDPILPLQLLTSYNLCHLPIWSQRILFVL